MPSRRDLVQALDCVKALISAANHDEFVNTLVTLMHPLMRAVVTGYNEADTVHKRFAFVLHPRKFTSDELIKAWVDHAHENPLIQNLHRNPGDYSVYKITDFVAQHEFRKTGLCQKVYQPMGAEYQIAMPFPVPGSAAIAVVFNRERDFGKRDIELLRLLQPLISAAYLNVQRMTDLQMTRGDASPPPQVEKGAKKPPARRLDLTQRQNEVLRQLVQGRSNKQIALQLKLSVRTVEKYVEHLLRKLNVPTRAAACAQYQSLFREAG